MACTCLVSAPTEMKSTPVWAISPMVSRSTLPETSSGDPAGRERDRLGHHLPAEIVQHDAVDPGRPVPGAARREFSTSTSSSSVGLQLPRRLPAAAMLPAAMMWFSLIRMASYRPMRWLCAAAAAHRVLLRQAQAGHGLAGVQHAHARCRRPQPRTPRSASRCADSNCRKFSAERSARDQRAGVAGEAAITLPASTRLPSRELPVDLHGGIEPAEAGIEPGRAGDHGILPAGQCGVRARSAGNSPAVASPVPRSSAIARSTSGIDLRGIRQRKR